MSGFKNIKMGSVEIEHFSGASLIKVIFKHQDQIDQSGTTEEKISEQWFEYSEFSDLKKACNLTDNWL